MKKETDILLEIDTSRYGPLDFMKYQELIDLGYREGMEKLPDLFQKANAKLEMR